MPGRRSDGLRPQATALPSDEKVRPMRKISPGSIARRDRVAECHTRASADRLEAEGMDTSNGRRKLELSAETWDARAELLGRLDASFNKREQLDAAARLFHSARGGEVGASVTGKGKRDATGSAAAL